MRQVIGIPSQSGLVAFLSSFLSLPCFDTLIFTICPVRPITGVLHFYAFCGVGKQRVQLLPSDITFPLCLGSCATKQACVRNQESPSRANHFNRHLPAKHRFKLEQRILNIIELNVFFLMSGTLVWLRQNRQVGLCDWNITFCHTINSKFFPPPPSPPVHTHSILGL